MVRLGLYAAIAVLTIAGLIALLVISLNHGQPSAAFARGCQCPADFFDLQQERNLPNSYQALALFACAVLLGRLAFIVGKESIARGARWGGLAVVFLFFSIDERVEIHEEIRTYDADLFYLVIPLGLAITAAVGGYTRLLSSLEPRVRRLFIVSAALYAGGAVALEYVYGLVRREVSTFSLEMLGTLCEVLEMLAIASFIYALLLQIDSVSRVQGAADKAAQRPHQTTPPVAHSQESW